MPSGGGSFGGGGGGGGFSGGGFSGGGFSSGGYHSHSYHSHRYYGSSSGGTKCSRREAVIWSGAIVLVTLVIIMISLMVRYTQNVNESDETYYSPGDTRLIELNTLFCRKITLSESSTFTNADLFLLTKEEIPSITDQNNFTISQGFALQSQEFQFWQYHLYRNSNVSISACIIEGSGVTLYVIKGNNNYNSWTSDGSSSYSEQNIFISQLCTGITRGGTTININEEDEWYFVFANTGTGLDQVSVSLNFERFQYTTDSLTGVDQTCSTASDGDCSLDVKFRSERKYALIVTSIPNQGTIDWGENVDVEWDCARNHGGYFLVIGVPIFGLIFLIAIGVGVVLLVLCGLKYKHRIRFPRIPTVHFPRLRTSPQDTHEISMSSNTNDPESGSTDDVPEEVLKMQQSGASTDPRPPPPPYENAPPPYTKL